MEYVGVPTKRLLGAMSGALYFLEIEKSKVCC